MRLVEELGDRAVRADFDPEQLVFESTRRRPIGSRTPRPRRQLASRLESERQRRDPAESGTLSLRIRRSAAAFGLAACGARDRPATTRGAAPIRTSATRAAGAASARRWRSAIRCCPAVRRRCRGQRAVADPSRRLDDFVEHAVGVLIDLVDRGAGQDVVELVEQQRLPGCFELVARDTSNPSSEAIAPNASASSSRCSDCAVELLDLAPGWSACRGAARGRARRPSVGRPFAVGSDGEELLDAAHPQPRQGREVLDPGVVLQHLLGRTAGAVAPAEGEQALGCAASCPRSSARCRACRAARCCRCSPARD